jgi:hypothetical protein
MNKMNIQKSAGAKQKPIALQAATILAEENAYTPSVITGKIWGGGGDFHI